MRLPLCAWCGAPMTAAAREKRAEGGMVMMDHPRSPHRPRYGWHLDCVAFDPLASWLRVESPRVIPVEEMTRQIAARGEGRVVMRKKP